MSRISHYPHPIPARQTDIPPPVIFSRKKDEDILIETSPSFLQTFSSLS